MNELKDILVKNKTMELIKSEMKMEETFMGVVVKPEGPSNSVIQKALNTSVTLLDIPSFMKVAEIEFDPIMFNHFWQTIVCTGSHIGTSTLNWLGYEGESKIQKNKFKELLKRNKILFNELEYGNDEIENYPSIKQEMSLIPIQGGAKTRAKWLVMEPDDFKMAIMKLNTKNGDAIRRYYVTLEKIIKLHSEYSLYFHDREKQRQMMTKDNHIQQLEQMMLQMRLNDKQFKEEMFQRNEEHIERHEELIDKNDELLQNVKEVKHKLNIAVIDRAPQPVKKSLQERFLLLHRNDDDTLWPYYAIRGQLGYTKTTLQKELENYGHMKIILDFKCNPNSKTLFVRIKKELKARGVLVCGNGINLNNIMDEEELKTIMEEINDEKFTV